MEFFCSIVEEILFILFKGIKGYKKDFKELEYEKFEKYNVNSSMDLYVLLA